MKVGIPRALLYYYYYPFWNEFFTALGCEVVVSDETNAQTISDGAQVTVSELCIPIKIMNGHIVNLLKKDVDYIFIPQFMSMGKEWYCPKFLGIDSITSYSIPELAGKVLAVTITSKTDLISKVSDYAPLAKPLSVSKGRIKAALRRAEAMFQRERELSRRGYTIPEVYEILEGKELPPPEKTGEVSIAFLGYVNNIYDNFVSMNAVKKLREMGVCVTTFEMLDEDALLWEKSQGKRPYWVFARKLYNAARLLVQRPEIDGVIHLTAFGCGPDSIIGKLMEIDCEAAHKPMMTLRVDEHTGESHIQTRLEAFVDMLKLSKQKAGTLS